MKPHAYWQMACESQVVSQWACGLMLCSGKPEIPSSQTQIRKVGKTPPSPTSQYKIGAVHVNWNKAVNLFMFVEKSVSSMNTNSDFQPASNQSSCKVHHCIVLCDQFHTNDLSLISLSQNTYFSSCLPGVTDHSFDLCEGGFSNWFHSKYELPPATAHN